MNFRKTTRNSTDKPFRKLRITRNIGDVCFEYVRRDIDDEKSA